MIQVICEIEQILFQPITNMWSANPFAQHPDDVNIT